MRGDSTRVWLLLTQFVCVLGIPSGCGTQTYRERVEKTRGYLEYVDQQTQNLAKKIWFEKDIGIKFRPPRTDPTGAPQPTEYTLLPAPILELDEQGKPIPPPVDPRQPSYVRGGLPGLLAAWSGELMVDGHNQNIRSDIFLLGNHILLADREKSEEAAAFTDNAVMQICRGLGVPLPKQEDYEEVVVPSRDTSKKFYVPRNSYLYVPLQPAAQIHGAVTDVSLYLATSGPEQVILVMVLPRNVDPRHKLRIRIPLCLETLRIGVQQQSQPAPKPTPPKKTPPQGQSKR